MFIKTLMQNCPSDLNHMNPLMVDVIVYKPSPYGLVFDSKLKNVMINET